MQPSCWEFGLPPLAVPHLPKQEFTMTEAMCMASGTFGGLQSREAQAHTELPSVKIRHCSGMQKLQTIL